MESSLSHPGRGAKRKRKSMNPKPHGDGGRGMENGKPAPVSETHGTTSSRRRTLALMLGAGPWLPGLWPWRTPVRRSAWLFQKAWCRT